LKEWNDPAAREWSAALSPLERAATARIASWLPKLEHPVRAGEHNNTAFAMGLMLDYARISGNTDFGELLKTRARDFYLKDTNCPVAYEPSDEDFLSPCLAEADAMRRVLPEAAFAPWFQAFVPKQSVPNQSVPNRSMPNQSMPYQSMLNMPMQPTQVADVNDGKLYHLAGLNLNRAWMLQGIASGLTANDPRRHDFALTREKLTRAGLDAIRSEHYEGGHWLAIFATYLMTGRGLAQNTLQHQP
jgi:hypothetical protein